MRMEVNKLWPGPKQFVVIWLGLRKEVIATKPEQLLQDLQMLPL